MFDSSVVFDLVLLLLFALVARLATWPLLRRAQRAVRERALSGSSGAGSGPVVAEVAVCVVLVVLLRVLTTAVPSDGFHLLGSPALFSDPFDLLQALGIPPAAAEASLWGGAAVLLAGWLLLAHRVRRVLLTVGMPAGLYREERIRRQGVLRLGLFAVLGVAVLPLGAVLAGAVYQALALVAARRHPAPAPPAAPAPVADPASNPYLVSDPYAAAADPFFSAPAADPFSSAPAAEPVPTPTARATAPATDRVQVPHQSLGAHEPRSIGGYQLLGRIGSGGMGTVYLARREGAATQVALKTINLELLDDPDLLRRFRRESEVLAMVPGAYTARVLDTGVDAGRPFLAMELLDGRPLDAHLRESGPLRSPAALRALALALAVALSGVHRLGLVHRDLKPANIMLTSAGPRLLDFGIAALVDGTRLTMTGANPGTLTYMAPEQFGDERVGTAADIWAWACCVVCAAHGASPFAATSTGGVIRRIVDTGPDPVALAAVRDLDPALAAVVARALTPDPAARPVDGAALLALLTPGRPEDLREEITRGWDTLRT